MMHAGRPRAAARLAAALLFVLIAAGTPPALADFVPGTDDVPLMPGLTADATAMVVFDKPDGRIVEVAAAGAPAAGDVRAFYARTLPQLGWDAAGEGRWTREGEHLELKITERAGQAQVRFTIAPRDRAATR